MLENFFLRSQNLFVESFVAAKICVNDLSDDILKEGLLFITRNALPDVRQNASNP